MTMTPRDAGLSSWLMRSSCSIAFVRIIMLKLLAVACLLIAATGFVPNGVNHRQGVFSSRLSLALATAPPPPAVVIHHPQQAIVDSSTSPLTLGIQDYASTQTLALKERRPPTAEEIAAKKRNFNLLFWGGGFVAPFLATFFYFGFKFWEK